EMAGREHKREQLRQEYGQLVNEAEAFFKERKLTEAREKYRSALTNHLPGFVPTQDYLEGQINLCQNSITFLKHYENGKAAMEDENYRLAIEYYQEALKINNNEKVEQLIIHCQQRLKSGRKRKRTAQTQPRNYAATASPPVKTRSPIWMKIMAGVGIVLALLVVVSLFVQEEPTDEPLGVYQDNSYQEESTQQQATTTDDYQEETYTPPAPTPEPATLPTEQMILGTWRVNAIDIMQGGIAYNAVEEDPSLAPYIGATYEFYNNNTVLLTLTTGYEEYLAYSALGNEIYVASAGFDVGTINRLDNRRLVATFPFTNLNGTFYVRYSLSR
ncbi:MAG: tetratricopeptide repeat protein, partial [Bacteroidota bacterium]